MSSNNKVITNKGFQCRIVLYDRRVLQLHKIPRQHCLHHRHGDLASGWRKGETRYRYFFVVSEASDCDCTLCRHTCRPFHTVECTPEVTRVEVIEFDFGAGIECCEGGCSVDGLLFKSGHDCVGQAAWDNAGDHCIVKFCRLEQDPRVEELNRIMR